MGQSSSNGFDQRKKAFESKYLHDEELNFRIHAKCHHLFGLWAATLLGYGPEETERYVETIIVFEIQKTHDEDVMHKVFRDLQVAKVEISEHRVQREFERCWEEAKNIIMVKQAADEKETV